MEENTHANTNYKYLFNIIAITMYDCLLIAYIHVKLDKH